MGVNQVALSGRLTGDPELRSTAGGTAVLEFRLAVSERRKNARTGQWEDAAGFFDCTVMGNRAEALARQLAKGSQVFVSGSLRYREWERDGQRRSKVEVSVRELDMGARPQGRDQAQGRQQPCPDRYADPYGEEIPF